MYLIRCNSTRTITSPAASSHYSMCNTAVFPEVLLVHVSVSRGNEKPAVIHSNTCTFSSRSDLEMWLAVPLCFDRMSLIHLVIVFEVKRGGTGVDWQGSKLINTSVICCCCEKPWVKKKKTNTWKMALSYLSAKYWILPVLIHII